MAELTAEWIGDEMRCEEMRRGEQQRERGGIPVSDECESKFIRFHQSSLDWKWMSADRSSRAVVAQWHAIDAPLRSAPRRDYSTIYNFCYVMRCDATRCDVHSINVGV